MRKKVDVKQNLVHVDSNIVVNGNIQEFYEVQKYMERYSIKPNRDFSSKYILWSYGNSFSELDPNWIELCLRGVLAKI